jgi:hypothetical protein
MSYQLSKLFSHSQVIIGAITNAEWRSTRSDLPAVKAEITTDRFPRAFLFTAADAIVATR